MRGINGVNDGQQIYSYDAAFQKARTDEVRSLFSYQVPALEIGTVMTEELATQMPRAFLFRRLSSGTCALAQNTYLGRDYMGSAGRFGNHLSHVVLADQSELLHYPCEYYGSGTLRDRMTFEEVNNPERPDFLPQPVLEPGSVVTYETVKAFLSEENRCEIMKNMVQAVLLYEKQKKRVVICDVPENIVMWIAAIEYTLPLRTALKLNFSTYDYDPSLSSSQISGVVPSGTAYRAESRRQHYVFDLLQNNCAVLEKDGNFFDFIETSMMISYESLQHFHAFLTSGYTYDQANEAICTGYRLYTYLCDGVGSISDTEVQDVLDFAGAYATPEELQRILNRLMEQTETLQKTDATSFLTVMYFVVPKIDMLSLEQRETLKQLMVERVLFELLNDGNSKEAHFIEFYDKVRGLAQQCGISIVQELMSNHYGDSLDRIVRHDLVDWKFAYIVRVFADFVKDSRIPVEQLLLDEPLGRFYYGLVQSAYASNPKSGFFLVTRILDAFSADCHYLVNMALNLEGILLDLADGQQEAGQMWKHFSQVMKESQSANLGVACSILNEYKRYEQMYLLYLIGISGFKDVTRMQGMFQEHHKAYVLADPEYAARFGDQVVFEYYRALKGTASPEGDKAKMELFALLCSEKKEVPFLQELVGDLLQRIPLKRLTKEHEGFVQDAFESLRYRLNLPIPGRMLLLLMGLELENCKKADQIPSALDSIEQLLEGSKADLRGLREPEAEDYIGWLLSKVCEPRDLDATKNLERLLHSFQMSNSLKTVFLIRAAQSYLKHSTENRHFGKLAEFLGLVFSEGNPAAREEIGKLLCKLNKKKLEELDEAMKVQYHLDKTALRHWGEIKKVAETTNPILNKLSNLFKWKRD